MVNLIRHKQIRLLFVQLAKIVSVIIISIPFKGISKPLCIKSYFKTRGAYGNFISNQLNSVWMPKNRLNKDYSSLKIRSYLSQIKEYENRHNNSEYQIKNWQFSDREFNNNGFLVLFPELKNNFDQNYQVYIFNNVVIHKPTSPDILNFQPRVFIFSEEGLLQEVIKLDEWLILKFEENFGQQIRLFRTMSSDEAKLFELKDYSTLKEISIARNRSRNKSYNSETPVFHFLAERPIGWTTDKDSVLAMDFEIRNLLKYVQSGDIKIGNGFEIQISSHILDSIMPSANVKKLPAFNFSRTKSLDHYNILSKIQ